MMSTNSPQPTLATTRLQETMTAICIDGVNYAVMLASPFDLEDFARGFALSEALIQHPSELRDIHIAQDDDGLTVDLQLSPRAHQAAKQRRRLLQGNTGCGLCGADAIAYALAHMPLRKVAASNIPNTLQIESARALLPALQIRNREAGGGMHAAALFGITSEFDINPETDDSTDINVIAVREDIGRHNALDKLIGATTHVDRTQTFALLTSRCSYELVLKCARAEISALITFATPTTLAVQCAMQCNITLACYYGPRLNFYHIANNRDDLISNSAKADRHTTQRDRI